MTHSNCSAAMLRRYSKLTMYELQAARVAIEADPENANPEHAAGTSIYLYKPAACSKLEAIAWAITARLREAKAGTA